MITTKSKLVSIAITLLLACVSHAQVARLVHYDGVLKDSEGTPFTGNVDVTISLYNRPAATEAAWSEEHRAVEVEDGKFSVLLGSVNPLKLSFYEYFLEVEVPGAGFEPSPKRTMIVGSGYNFRMWFLFAAYTIVWLALFLYMAFIGRRQTKLRSELQALAAEKGSV